MTEIEKYEFVITQLDTEKSITVSCASKKEVWKCTIDFIAKKEGYVKVRIERSDLVYNTYLVTNQQYNYVFFKSLVPMIFRKISAEQFTLKLKEYHRDDNPELSVKIKQQQTPDRTIGVLDEWYQNSYPNGLDQCLRKALWYDLENRKFCYRE